MNSIPLALDLLERQIALAAMAKTDFEKAAVYAAVTMLVHELEAEIGDIDGYSGEKLEELRWYTCALVGYDIDNGKDKTTLHSWALGALQALRDRHFQ